MKNLVKKKLLKIEQPKQKSDRPKFVLLFSWWNVFYAMVALLIILLAGFYTINYYTSPILTVDTMDVMKTIYDWNILVHTLNIFTLGMMIVIFQVGIWQRYRKLPATNIMRR